MGNCVSEASQKEFLKSLPSAAADGLHHADDPTSFRVFIKKRNKFIPGSLKISENEITFSRSRSDTFNWPLHFLRRYGFTSAGIFFFESGRRCTSGEGLHTFQSHQAEAIFQLVQSRIQDNANLGLAIREARSQSIASSIHSAHSSASGYTPLGARIHPIQRYSSEGTNSVMDYAQPSYSSYQRGDWRSLHNRNVAFMQAQKRPRSVASASTHIAVWPSSPSTFHPPHFNSYQPSFLGNIVSEERVVQRTASEGDSHSYVNVSPRRTGATSVSARTPQFLSPSQTTNGFDSRGVENGSRRFAPTPPFRSISENSSPACDRFFYERYVNIREINPSPATDRESTPPQLDYASVNVGSKGESSPIPSRSAAATWHSGVAGSSAASRNVNYAKIDLEKTHAVEVAASTVHKENPRRRHFTSS